MSEYQYYEFRALDQPLTKDQMAELRDLSSRAHITPVSFVNVYNYGDFRGSPRELMETYFDAFLYLSNWGTRELMFRIPKRLVDLESISAYCFEETLACWSAGEHVVFAFRAEIEDADWEEGEGWLTSLVQLRSDVMNDDHRCLYLGWLLAAQDGYIEDDEIEPPVPAGLKELPPALETLVEFLCLDIDLITAAAKSSASDAQSGLSRKEIVTWVGRLSSKEREKVLVTILEGSNPHILAELRKRALSDIRGAHGTGGGARKSDRRTVGELVARSKAAAQERWKAEAERLAREKAKRDREEAAHRKEYLEYLTGKEEDLWNQIEEHIAAKHHVHYDQAVSLLVDLRDLAAMNGNQPEFLRRMKALHGRNANRSALVKRFLDAKLL